MTLTWRRTLPTLMVLSLLGLAAGLLLMVPDGEGLRVVAYVGFAALLAGVLYVAGIKPLDPAFPLSLFLLAFGVKMLGSVGRYWMLVALYDNLGDAVGYHREGQYLAQYFSRLDLSVLDTWQMPEGTAQVALLNGVLYTIFPASLVGSYLFAAAVAFAGSVFFYRGFRVAFPDVPPGWYRVGVFFLPSVLFWPSSLGKEAWVFFGSGLVAWGLARFVRQGKLAGVLPGVLGLLLVSAVRPHFGAAMVLALAAAFLLFYRPSSAGKLALWLVGMAVLAVLGVFLLQSASDFLGLGPLTELSFEDVEELYDFRQRVTAQGGSGFSSPTVLTLLGPLFGIVTVLFRPFLWEAHNAQTLVAALEVVGWIAFFVVRRRVFWARIRSLRGDPWLAFGLVYTLIMILALTTLSNFSMLARQRVAILPFLWVLFA